MLLTKTAAGKTRRGFSFGWLRIGRARVSPLRRNVELKARCGDLAAARAASEHLGARAAGVLDQLDTYFHCINGRLKLRETAGVTPAELIWYQRANDARVRPSDYRLVAVPNPVELKTALAAALGVRGEVRKRRQLLLWHNVRIHLDDVESLGTFVEFEAVITPGEDEASAHQRLAALCNALSIQPTDYLPESYSDLKGL
jgi:adenylate cyclase class IV